MNQIQVLDLLPSATAFENSKFPLKSESTLAGLPEKL